MCRRVLSLFAVSVVILATLRRSVRAENCEELLRRAQELLAQDQPKEAVKPLREATEACPTSPKAYDLLGIAYDMQNRFEEAQQAHRKAVALSPSWPGYHNNLALSYARAGKGAEARNESRTALRLDPQNLVANANLADFCLRENQYRQALANLRNARANQSTDPLLQYALAQAYFGVGESKLALQTVERLFGLAPTDEKMRFAEGLLLAENHQRSEGVRQFEAIPVIERDFAICQNLRLAYSRLRQYEEAQTAFEQALRLDPSNPEPYFAIRLNLLDGRSPDQAVNPLTQARQRASQRVDIASALVQALVQARQLIRAGDLLAEVHVRAPNEPAVMKTEGDLYVADGEDAKALNSYRRALQLFPENLSARLSLAKRYLRLEQIAQARTEFERVVRSEPTNAEGHAG
ncbi:MAG: tetratricopeptide repeat protein [Terriglobia bacterium]|jgi:Flp pilus assembly protein TadD